MPIQQPQQQELEPRINSSLLFTRVDGTQDFVHDNFKDFMLAWFFIEQGLDSENIIDRHELHSVVPFYAALMDDAGPLIKRLTGKDTLRLLRESVIAATTIADESLEYAVSELFIWFTERENEIALTIHTCVDRSYQTLEELALQSFGDKFEAFYHSGLLCYTLDNLPVAESFYDKALEFVEQGSLRHADLLYQLGRSYRSRSNSVQALELFDTAAEICESIPGDEAKSRIAHSKFEKGLILSEQGGELGAINAFSECSRYFKEAGEELNFARSMVQIGENNRYLGNLDQARKAYEIAIPILKRFNYTRGIAEVQLGMAGVLEHEGKFDEALESGYASLKANVELGFKRRQGYCQNRLASIYNKMGNLEKAMHHVDQAIALWTDCLNRKGIAYALRIKSELFEKQEDYMQAYETMAECVSIREELKLPIQSKRRDYRTLRNDLKVKAGIE